MQWNDYRHWLRQPLEVSIETFAQCNAACTFCPYPTLERIGAKMPDELLDRLVKQMAVWPQRFIVSFFKVNEPLLDKRVLPLMERVGNHIANASLRLFSNGSTLTDDNVDRIAGLKRLHHLWISLNDHREAEYEALMGLSWKKTTGNLDRLHAREGFPHQVMLSCVGYPNEDFRRYCFDRWPKFESMAIKRDAWIDFTSPDIAEVPDTPCSRWWELNITATGKAALCCMDGRGEYGFGDVNEQTMLEIYNHPTLRAWRESMIGRRQAGNPCNRCSY